ncbi:MAG: threonine--tRNA ligase [Candidatus Harrisonbacteria bacterium RIFCSPHIGHO2_01_FULL_44_13]|uniref:Threonine--tRNA ligase n=1 Tax=Candidatus Harrisonbacteria bacterium RIFCSPLOWO2_01_FULL_44_18 TaxID=1798407 RepID=A0A1G1ZMZ1_9BACT|nr:MAG: threonine--tRNA ligase [Candidatus Harrisonbacteria bacterium RIFCSPHIGHO2_01_FULL_44_13]OGY65207.1 MAG: threonine--tRNA ligase [Candidatus Harrisonbacteria bacterium RIFCSPLOWO2_01_FULL_44_18]
MAKKQIATIENIRHSLAHLLAAAVLEKFPDAKLGIGPVIENGFYYDFLLPRTLTPEDLKDFENEMRALIKQKLAFRGKKVTAVQAKKFFGDQPFKLELIKEFSKEKKPLSVYHTGKIFMDLCRGGHVKNTGEINLEAFKLDKIAGAYWRGNEKNPQLQRIYGLAFETKKELDDYLAMRVEAEKRDHRKLGKELKLFTFSDYVGPGLPLWLPKGTVIIEALERLAKETEQQAGYQQVRTPHIAKEIMYKTSGHLPYYAESMFPPMILKEEDGQKETYYLKAMNCPHHHQIYAAEPRSYRDLPLRLSEYGTVYRYEKSGELFGLMRVRMLSMNDAHIYCAEEQFESEFNAVNDMYLKYFKLFGFDKYIMRFSTHDPKELGKKYVNEPKLWKKTEDMARKVLVESKINFVEVPDEAAFYGPKIDVQIWSSIGREFTLATNQVDFTGPRRFGLTYVDKDGKEKTPLVIHRAPLGTHERFIGFLIEHYAGAFPFWLAPVQIKIVPVADRHVEYAQKVAGQLNNFRVEIAGESETVGKKIRNAELEKIPYILVVGDVEEKNKTVRVRERHKGDLGEMDLEDLVKKLTE